MQLPKPLASVLAALILVGASVGAVAVADVGVSSAQAGTPDQPVSPDDQVTDSPAETDEATGDDVAPDRVRERDRDRDGDWLDRLEASLDALDLTDEQIEEILTTAERMHADGANRAEIEAMVRGKLAEFGVDGDDARREFRWARFQAYFDLTDEQVEEIRTDAVAMRVDGATRTEVLRMVVGKLDSFGVDQAKIDRFIRYLRAHAGDGDTDRPRTVVHVHRHYHEHHVYHHDAVNATVDSVTEGIPA